MSAAPSESPYCRACTHRWRQALHNTIAAPALTVRVGAELELHAKGADRGAVTGAGEIIAGRRTGGQEGGSAHVHAGVLAQAYAMHSIPSAMQRNCSKHCLHQTARVSFEKL